MNFLRYCIIFFKSCIFNNRTEMFLVQSASYCDNLIVIKARFPIV